VFGTAVAKTSSLQFPVEGLDNCYDAFYFTRTKKKSGRFY